MLVPARNLAALNDFFSDANHSQTVHYDILSTTYSKETRVSCTSNIWSGVF
jgi:hypothetical protein